MNVSTPIGAVRIVREFLDAQGYTRHGQYFGLGPKLYLIVTDESQIHVRAPGAYALARWCRALTSAEQLHAAKYRGIDFT
jgi:hypothetical protein